MVKFYVGRQPNSGRHLDVGGCAMTSENVKATVSFDAGRSVA